MKISGRTFAYLIILLAIFMAGGITFVGAQGFIENPLPVPVENNGITEVVQKRTFRISRAGSICPAYGDRVYQVPEGKRLIIEHVSAAAWSDPTRRVVRGSPAVIIIRLLGGTSESTEHVIAVSDRYPISGGGPITMYADPGQTVHYAFFCPDGIGIDDSLTSIFNFTGRLVPYPHPSMIPTVTPPPG